MTWVITDCYVDLHISGDILGIYWQVYVLSHRCASRNDSATFKARLDLQYHPSFLRVVLRRVGNPYKVRDLSAHTGKSLMDLRLRGDDVVIYRHMDCHVAPLLAMTVS